MSEGSPESAWFDAAPEIEVRPRRRAILVIVAALALGTAIGIGAISIDRGMTPAEFIKKWKPVALTERANAHSHFLDVCALPPSRSG